MGKLRQAHRSADMQMLNGHNFWSREQHLCVSEQNSSALNALCQACLSYFAPTCVSKLELATIACKAVYKTLIRP
jgi:hypothetical protein